MKKQTKKNTFDFSFNNPNGMCTTCAGIGKTLDLDIEQVIDGEKTYDEGCFNLPAFFR